MKRWVLILVIPVAAWTWFSGVAGIRSSQGDPNPALEAVPTVTQPPGHMAEETVPVGSPAAESEPEDSVHVVHDLIHVTPPPAPPPPQRPRIAPAVRKVPGDQRADRRTDSDPLIARAGRVLIGDGRHRPEPFPKP